MTYCSKCGAPVAPGAEYCARCGTPVGAAAPAAAVPQPPAARPRRSAPWWIVPAALVGLVVIVWAVLAGMPFRRETPQPRVSPPVETVGEAPAPAAPATIVDVAPTTITEDVGGPAPTTAARPAPVTPPPALEITSSQADATLRGYLASAKTYGVSNDCLAIHNNEYENVGYTLEVWDECSSGGGARRLGRWRVDAKTREIFRQREDGRYLRP